jgi:hypothetical protein
MKTSTVVRLACVNALGFSASTVMPLWLGRIAKELGMPPWFASAAVFAQLASRVTFVIGVVVLAITTLFSLPYFFAQLGSFDGNGRYTSFAAGTTRIRMLTSLRGTPGS